MDDNPLQGEHFCRKRKILFIDDESNVLDGFRRMLRNQRKEWDMSYIGSVDAALELIEERYFDVIVSDIKMPEKDGFELLKILHKSERTRNIPVIIITGCNESDMKCRALDLGATDLLNKPVCREDLLARLHSVLRLKSYQDELNNQNKILEHKVRERTIELENSRLDILWRLGKVAEFRDEETGNHVIRVGWYCKIIAESLGMRSDFVEMLFLTSPLHDIGKVGIPDEILLKGGRLNHDQWEIMKRHCIIGSEIFNQDYVGMKSFLAWSWKNEHKRYNNENNPLYKMASSVTMTHHEKWDGTGYPKCLAGDEIPLASRIVAISDVYDALCSERPYKSAFSENEALTIMGKEVGLHFDPDVYHAFAKSLSEIRIIKEQFSDKYLKQKKGIHNKKKGRFEKNTLCR
ncbi:response regulator receiver modulated metal dependent phosphohydrolase [Candidatus Scalindua japonica]|uniref:Response regulator receiver modulated metal dependent phosphohydrolase n=1 Tax=Candidatus Scalindua japonica TaxID=1284222 RepID=A0A286TUH7_9BACT|nr:HD domain-containing phosphohydrolase [Candidatus Scalindua japonica]GAX59514.1 response regulator receiver modulated metal dependent phosphohydrolase [Candidatus Scalindua japonica]